MTHKICLIIPHHISFQPRSLREADSLDEGGWDVKVVSRQSDPLLVASDRRLIRDRKWKLETVDLRRDDIFSNTWFLES